MVQNLANKLLALKKQVSQGSLAPACKDGPRRTYPNSSNHFGNSQRNQSKLPVPQGRLVLEAPTKNVVVRYYEATQQDFTQLEYQLEENANLFQEEEDSARDLNIGYLNYEEEYDQEDEPIVGAYAISTHSQNQLNQ